MKVLVDGWPLSRQPNSPQALYIQALLAYRPQGVEYTLACPQKPRTPLAGGVQVLVEPVGETARDLLGWQQRVLNRLSKKTAADLIHLSSHTPPFLRSVPVVIAEAGYGRSYQTKGNFYQRLGNALASGATQRGQTWILPPGWPQDSRVGASEPLMPFVHPAFSIQQPPPSTELGERYALYHGPSTPDAMVQLIDAWSYVTGSMGDSVTLVLIDVQENGRLWLESFIARYGIDFPFRLAPQLSIEQLAAVYQRAEVLIYPGEPLFWGSPVVHGVYCSVPVVGYDDEQMDALIGPAGMLVETGNSRQLGASILTVLVNPGVREGLARAAKKRNEAWSQQDTATRLGEIYHQVVVEA